MVAGRTTQSGPHAQKPALTRVPETLQEKLEVEHAPTHHLLSEEMIVEDTTLIMTFAIKKFLAVIDFLFYLSSTVGIAFFQFPYHN